MRVEVEAFSDDAIACKDAIQVGPNYKPGGATFGAGTKTPIVLNIILKGNRNNKCNQRLKSII